MPWCDVGGLYERGDGIPKDLLKAYFWYNLCAARFGSVESGAPHVANRDRIEKLLTPAQIAEAQELTRRWRKEHDQGAATMPALSTSNSGTAIRSEIDQVARDGRYTSLPVAMHCIPYSGTGALRTIENATSYNLHLVFTGPVDREVSIASQQKQSIDLPAGTYKVLGRVSSANVLPLYGQETYTMGQECAVQFFIR